MYKKESAKLAATVPPFLLLWLPCMATLATTQVQGVGQVFSVLGFSLCVLLLPLALIGHVRRYFWFWLPLVPLLPVYVYLAWLFGSAPGDVLVAATLRTGWRQIWEMLAGFGLWLVLVPVLLAVYVWLVLRVDRGWMLSSVWRQRVLAVLLLYALTGLAGRQLPYRTVELPPLFGEYAAGAVFPANLLVSLTRVWQHEQRQSPAISVKGRSMTPDAPLLVVLVLGESLRADHLGIHGYARETTPGLRALGASLISFRDAASTSHWTYGAIPNMVSREVGGYRASLVQTFGEAGFQTAWLSNQEPSDFSRAAQFSDHPESSLDLRLRQDTALLPLLQAFLHQGRDRQFVVLHMNGSHFPYEERYTSEARLFRPTLSDLGVDALPGPQHKAAAINSYDNTVVATDRFLSRVIAMLQAQPRPALLLYSSDHGENLFDDERQLFMHALPTATRHDIHVPLLVWMNQGYEKAYPSIGPALRANTGKRVSHLNIFPTLLEMAAIQWEGHAPGESLAAPDFREHARKLVWPGASVPPVYYESLR